MHPEITQIVQVHTPNEANEYLRNGWIFIQAVPTGGNPNFILGKPKEAK